MKRLRIRAMRELGVIDALDALERYARAFDAISSEQDAHYSARSFVRWVRLETAPKGIEPKNSDELQRGHAA